MQRPLPAILLDGRRQREASWLCLPHSGAHQRSHWVRSSEVRPPSDVARHAPDHSCQEPRAALHGWPASANRVQVAASEEGQLRGGESATLGRTQPSRRHKRRQFPAGGASRCHVGPLRPRRSPRLGPDCARVQWRTWDCSAMAACTSSPASREVSACKQEAWRAPGVWTGHMRPSFGAGGLRLSLEAGWATSNPPTVGRCARSPAPE